MKKYKSYETQRLNLIPTGQDDVEFILELLNTPKWLEYIGDRNVHSIADVSDYINKKITPQFERLGYGNYTVVRKSDNAKIGSCGLYDREGLEGVDIGFGFLPNYEGNGYALESAVKLKELAMSEFNIDSIAAITTENNIASQKLITKLGLEFVKFTSLADDKEELMLYQMNKIEP